MPWVTVSRASELLTIHTNTVRRRLTSGELEGRKDGARWLVHVAEDLESRNGAPDVGGDLLAFLQDQVRMKDEQIGELIYTLRDLQARALPAPRRSFWSKLFRKG